MPPENRRGTGGRPRADRGRFAPGASGNPASRFRPGVSPNPGGRPKGSGTYQVRTLWAQALDNTQVLQMIIQRLRGAITQPEDRRNGPRVGRQS